MLLQLHQLWHLLSPCSWWGDSSPISNFHVPPFNASQLVVTCLCYFSVKSFVQLVQYLFTSFLSERISQETSGKVFFGRHRQRGGVNENPNVAKFLKEVINSINLDITKGNTRGSNRSSLPGKENLAPLPKRRRTKHTGIYIYSCCVIQKLQWFCLPYLHVGSVLEETAVTVDSPYEAASPSGKYAWFCT